MRLGKKCKIRKNRRIGYNEDKFVKQNYMFNGKAIIPILFNDIDDLYMKHDYKKIEMSNDVFEYIEEVADMVPMDTDIVLEVHCPRLNDESRDRVVKTMKNNFAMEMDDADFEISRINRKALIFTIVGLLVLAVNILTEKYIGPVVSNFICVIWWVAIWDMVELLCFDKTEWQWKRLNYQQLYDSQVTFVFDVESD